MDYGVRDNTEARSCLIGSGSTLTGPGFDGEKIYHFAVATSYDIVQSDNSPQQIDALRLYNLEDQHS